jgi:flagellar basal-body rod protein FlgB
MQLPVSPVLSGGSRAVDPGRLSLFRLAEQRLDWLDRRQKVLAQNIANADTPGYAARDLLPFADRLRAAGHVAPARTSKLHLSSGTGPPGARTDRHPRETTLDGNRVGLDEQLMKVSDTEIHQGLTTSVYRKYLGLFRIALGRSG